MVAEPAVVTTSVGFNDSASLDDAEGGGAEMRTSFSLGSSPFGQFNANLGVLTGATLNLTSTRTQTVTVSAESVSSNNDQWRKTNGEGSSSAALSAPGVTLTFATISQSGSCSGGRLTGCGPSAFSTSAAANATVAIPVDSLDDYVGSGTVDLKRSAPSLSAYQADNKFKGKESTTYALRWEGTLTATYEYLSHAAPSFSKDSELLTLSYDFGTLDLGEDAATWSFDIFNLLGADRVGLDLDSIVGDGDGDFARFLLSGPGSFANLAPGKGSDYEVDFETSWLGDFSATYFFNLSDADVGAASSRYPYRLMLSLSGNVVPVGRQIEPRNNVPEPATLALFTLGVAALPLVRRRRTPA